MKKKDNQKVVSTLNNLMELCVSVARETFITTSVHC